MSILLVLRAEYMSAICSVHLLVTSYCSRVKCLDVSIHYTNSAQRTQGMCSVELHLVIIELLKTQMIYDFQFCMHWYCTDCR